MDIKKIPMYIVEGCVLSEDALHELMVDVKDKLQPANMRVSDVAGNEFTINDQGFLIKKS